MLRVDSAIKKNRSLFWAGICQIIYGIIELTDTISIILISIGILPNFYVSFISVDSPIGVLLETTPVAFIVVFAFFTSIRLVSGYWILQNRLKGFWLALCITGVTLVAVWFFLPFAIIDMAFITPFLIMLFRGFFGEDPIIEEVKH